MYKTTLTIGLYDKDTCRQEISSESAKNIVTAAVLRSGVYGATVWDCRGIYTMQSTGEIVEEPSIRVEFCDDFQRDISGLVADLKARLNQESIMVERAISNVSFL